ncbi:MAG: dTMP kinase [Dehalococcoidales bacterium]|jgi:dTMP kinase|nr:dTMP kinase [Dehalococcoidales bacterium]MDD3264310.1 dTMP kinase [Dehalococcoidales bacterium]MDD4322069.1 dTMP kinase [Dehalococcoidales bacterium]MDD4793640.1 dTMP kinase [Dehalococcoidales bacterium]MDD5122258.1 dTMP kinase [Dehalococcoidales bacterium]
MNNSSLFITFEGLDGCGKSLQASRLSEYLQKAGRETILLHEPGSTPLGEEISRLVKWHEAGHLSPITELFLFNASRAQLVQDTIKPALAGKKNVIVDRFTDSTLVYQGYGRGLDLEMIRQVNEIALQGCQPDVSILLDVPIEIAATRRKKTSDRFEAEDISFHRKIRSGYLELAENEPERWLVIDGTLDKGLITEIVTEQVIWLLESKEV